MRDKLAVLWERPWLGPLVSLVLVYLLFVGLSPDFGRLAIAESMLRETVAVAICAVGMTLIMVKGGIDLSVGSLVALTTVVIARALRDGSSPTSAAMQGLLVGLLGGFINGTLIAKLRVMPFIVTLGTMSMMRGAAKGLADEKMISADAQWLEDLTGALLPEMRWMQLAPGVWIALFVAAAAAVLLAFTPLGRHIVAIGSNEHTARLCGVPIARVTVITYSLAGLLAGLAGVMVFSKLTVGDPTVSVGLELEVIAAVVIGGGSLSGGKGSVPGALLGALFMTLINRGCSHLGLPNWVQEIITGIIIVAAVTLDRVRQRG